MVALKKQEAFLSPLLNTPLPYHLYNTLRIAYLLTIKLHIVLKFYKSKQQQAPTHKTPPKKGRLRPITIRNNRYK